MIYLNDPLDIINVIIIIAASIEAAYLYKVTRRPSFILYFIFFYIALLYKFTYEIPYEQISLQIMTYTAALYMVYAMYRDKLWSLFAIGAIGSLIITMIAVGTPYILHGEGMIFLGIMMWVWYKTTPICFNPIKCPIYKFKPIK